MIHDKNFILKHKDVDCATISINDNLGFLVSYKEITPEYMPFLGNASLNLMQQWWKNRAVPSVREDIKEKLNEAGCENSQLYLAKNLALSLTDSYWICPFNTDLRWSDVNLYKNVKELDKTIPLHNQSTYDPNASLGGEMNKYWDYDKENGLILSKKAYRGFGQQSINEKFATEIHNKQHTNIPYVKYSITNDPFDNAIIASCPAFTSEKLELVPAYEVINSVKKRGSTSNFNIYMDACIEYGIKAEDVQNYMDYLILTDFIISNQDRHFNNLGIIRDSDNLKVIGLAPIYDSGNSMFFNINESKPLNEVNILELKINSFSNSEEKMLTNICDRTVVDFNLIPTPDFVEEFYFNNNIPEHRVEFLKGSYASKYKLVEKFISGSKISLYNEKKSLKNNR